MLVLPCIILGYAFTIAFNSVEGLRGPCSIDAAVKSVGNKKIYLFKGNKYGRWNEGKRQVEQIAAIAQDWGGIPNDLDAATTYKGTNFFFKGCQYWRYHGKGRSDGPHSIIRFGVPCNVDAAATMGGSLYLFKGGYYWRWNDKDFSRPLSIKQDWDKLEGNIDAAVHSNTGDTYFLKERKTWFFEKNSNKAKIHDAAVGWGNLFDSKLLPDCPCDCNTCCDNNWEFYDITYQTDQAQITQLSPEAIGRKELDNRNATGISIIEFTVSKTVTETQSFTHTVGASVTVGTEFKTGIPFVAEGKVSVEVTASYEYEYGTQRSVSRTREITFTCQGVPRRKTVCIVRLHYNKLDVPYTMVLKHKRKGCTCESKGIFTGVASTDMQMQVMEFSKK